MVRDVNLRLTTVGQCLLVALGLAWALFERPAPVINVLWHSAVTADQRHRLEQQFFLESGEETDGSWRYVLGWPAASNVSAIVRHPDVRDTHHVNRSTFQLDGDIALSSARVWWVGPFRGTRGRTQFRYTVGTLAALTLIGAGLARRSVQAPGRGEPNP
jgi:hypothetical protein